MEDKDEYLGTSSELHKKLEGVAKQLGVSVTRDKAWPKSARWLWRRIKEVLPLLVAADIDASREHTDRGSAIVLRKAPKNDVSNVREEESGGEKAKSPDIRPPLMSDSNVRSESNVRANVSPNPANHAGSDITDNTDIRSGDFSEELSTFLREPPAWYRRQAQECVRQGAPERLLKPLAAAVAYDVLGNTHRWCEVMPHVEAALAERSTP